VPGPNSGIANVAVNLFAKRVTAAPLASRCFVTETGCWQWMGPLSQWGYGKAQVRGHTVAVHRVFYESVLGPIPERHTLDHLCRNRGCVNPYHLDPVLIGENLLRSPLTLNGIAAAKTHCYQGHAFAEHGYTDYRGRRACRICTKLKMQRRKKPLANV
jgi:hypothetical protein